MKCHPVPFAVEHDGPKAVRTDGMDCLKDLTALGCNRSDCLLEAPLRIEIDERADLRRRVVIAW